MLEELICPDCGGLIGGEPGSGRQVCRCFEERRQAVVPPGTPADSSTEAAPGFTDGGAKPCRICNRDLRGHRRLKDSRGYMCLDCDAAARGVPPAGTEQDLNLIPCPECGRKLKIDGMTTLNGAVMCKRCATEFKELRKYKGPPVALVTTQKEAEKVGLQKLLVIGGVLLLIMALAWFGWIGR